MYSLLPSAFLATLGLLTVTSALPLLPLTNLVPTRIGTPVGENGNIVTGSAKRDSLAEEKGPLQRERRHEDYPDILGLDDIFNKDTNDRRRHEDYPDILGLDDLFDKDTSDKRAIESTPSKAIRSDKEPINLKDLLKQALSDDETNEKRDKQPLPSLEDLLKLAASEDDNNERRDQPIDWNHLPTTPVNWGSATEKREKESLSFDDLLKLAISEHNNEKRDKESLSFEDLLKLAISEEKDN